MLELQTALAGTRFATMPLTQELTADEVAEVYGQLPWFVAGLSFDAEPWTLERIAQRVTFSLARC